MIDKDLLVQNLKESYTILQQQQVVIDEMLEIVDTLNSVDFDKILADIEEINTRLDRMHEQITTLISWRSNMIQAFKNQETLVTVGMLDKQLLLEGNQFRPHYRNTNTNVYEDIALTVDVQTVQTELDDMGGEVATHETRLNTYEFAIKSCENSITNNQNAIKDCETNITSANTSINDIYTKLVPLQANVRTTGSTTYIGESAKTMYLEGNTERPSYRWHETGETHNMWLPVWSDYNSLDGRVTALEQGGGGGGASIYQHTITINVSTEETVNAVIVIYNNSATQLITFEQISPYIRTNKYLASGIGFNLYMCLITETDSVDTDRRRINFGGYTLSSLEKTIIHGYMDGSEIITDSVVKIN